MEQEPKISLPEIIIITPYLVIFDAIGLALIIAGLDDFFVLDAVRFPVTQLYLRFKGVKGTATLIGNILELIPYVGGLPISTAAWLITIYLDRHPETAEVLDKLGSVKKIGQSYQGGQTDGGSAKNSPTAQPKPQSSGK